MYQVTQQLDGWFVHPVDDNHAANAVCRCWQEAKAQRIVACVNALAGRNPAALAALEAALEKALATRERLPGAQGGEGCNGAYRILHLGDLQAALAAFRGQA